MAALHILVLSHYFPPEVNAAANRFHEMGRFWVQAGHKVTVVTCAPNHPRGKLYQGYRNRLWQREKIAGMDVIRLWTMLAPNAKFLRRTLNYTSYLAAVVFAAPFLPEADVVVATSPQFFCGLAGYPASRLKRIPWVLDIRDLWPDSIVAVGAMRPGRAIQAIKAIERFAYRKATHIVAASAAFVPHLEQSSVERSRISVITNGVDTRFLTEDPHDGSAFRKIHGLEGKFVASYIGTLGMAHGLGTVLQAADRLRAREDIAFVLVGDGAERDHLIEQCRAMSLSNMYILPQVPRVEVPGVWSASDVALVVLRDKPTFELVIPSKMLEAFAMGKPVILGVRGEARRIVEAGDCGIAVVPEDPADLARAVAVFADDRDLAARQGANGHRLAVTSYDRDVLADRYLQLLASVASQSPRGGDRANYAKRSTMP
jgi:glycosyltransferase involved in cell wall biosynthesis